MKNLDESIANLGILDDSFSNVSGEESPMNVSQSPKITSNTATTSLPSNFNIKPIVNRPIYVEGKKSTVSQLVSVSPNTSSSGSVKDEKQNDNLNQYMPVIPYGGGGSSSESSSKEAVTENTILGLKPMLVYGILGLGVAAFVYFKWIKK